MLVFKPCLLRKKWCLTPFIVDNNEQSAFVGDAVCAASVLVVGVIRIRESERQFIAKHAHCFVERYPVFLPIASSLLKRGQENFLCRKFKTNHPDPCDSLVHAGDHDLLVPGLAIHDWPPLTEARMANGCDCR